MSTYYHIYPGTGDRVCDGHSPPTSKTYSGKAPSHISLAFCKNHWWFFFLFQENLVPRNSPLLIEMAFCCLWPMFLNCVCVYGCMWTNLCYKECSCIKKIKGYVDSFQIIQAPDQMVPIYALLTIHLATHHFPIIEFLYLKVLKEWLINIVVPISSIHFKKDMLPGVGGARL